MRDLLVVVPSRGRPHNIARLETAMAATCRGDTRLVVGLDEDDPTAGGYPEGPEYVVASGIRFVGAWINHLAVPRVNDFRFIGTIGDDNIPETPGWDVAIMEALGETPFAFGNDLYPRPEGSLCCHVFTRSEVIARLGFLATPQIIHMGVDIAWMAWGRACGITFLPEAIIRHAHFTVGQAPLDETYAASTALIPPDMYRWHDYCRTGLNADIAKIDPDAPPYTAASLNAFNATLFIGSTWQDGDIA